VLATLALATPAHAAKAKLPAPVRDCATDGRIDHHYSKAALRSAIKKVPAKYKFCKERLNRVLKHGGDGRLAASGSRTKIIRDCTDNSRLDKRYPLSSIRKVAKKLPTDVKEYSRCGQVLRSEIRARS